MDRLATASGTIAWKSPTLRLHIFGPSGDWWVVPNVPFARIGSGPDCEVMLPEAGLPSLAYYIHEGMGWVQILSLNSALNGQTGLLKPGGAVNIGEYRIEPVWSTDDIQPNSASHEVDACVNIVGRCQSRDMKLRRFVTTVGGDFPSLLRLRRLGLESCRYIAYLHESQLWLVDLVRSTDNSPEANLPDVHVIHVGESIKLGLFDIGLRSVHQIPVSLDGAVENQSIKELDGTMNGQTCGSDDSFDDIVLSLVAESHPARESSKNQVSESVHYARFIGKPAASLSRLREKNRILNDDSSLSSRTNGIDPARSNISLENQIAPARVEELSRSSLSCASSSTLRMSLTSAALREDSASTRQHNPPASAHPIDANLVFLDELPLTQRLAQMQRRKTWSSNLVRVLLFASLMTVAVMVGIYVTVEILRSAS